MKIQYEKKNFKKVRRHLYGPPCKYIILQFQFKKTQNDINIINILGSFRNKFDTTLMNSLKNVNYLLIELDILVRLLLQDSSVYHSMVRILLMILK